MSARTNSIAQAPEPWTLPYRGKVAMAGLIIAESAIFTIFVVAYLFYTGKSLTGPTPREVLHRSEEHTSELQSLRHLVCRLLLEKKKLINTLQRDPKTHWQPDYVIPT